MKYFLLLLLSSTFTITFGQKTFQIKDALSLDPIPFVKVIPNTGNATHADIDGYFLIDTSLIHQVTLRNIGYFDTTYSLTSSATNTLFLRQKTTELDEVRIVPGINPAIRIIENTIANKSSNNPKENDAFTYNSYSKFHFTLDPKVLEEIPADTKDQHLIDLRNTLTSQYFFLLENASTRNFIPPYKDKEVITAYKVSGFTNPLFSTFTNSMQSFSFYENQFDIMGKSYINPIAFGSIKRYNYILEDITTNGNDTTFIISYKPKPGKNFDAMRGQLFIHSNGWAIEKVITEPIDEKDQTKIKIIQEYTFIEGKKWFPAKLSAEIVLASLQVDAKLKHSYVVGKGNTYIKDVVLNPEKKMKNFGNLAIQTAEDANEKSSAYWDSVRVHKITPMEEKTYQVIDSISTENKLESKANWLLALADGKLPMGYVNLDLKRIINFNLYEGYRFGAGLETSSKLIKRATIGGYFAWATRDKEWKYGGFTDIRLAPSHDFRIRLEFQQDVINRGGLEFLTNRNTFSVQQLYQNFYIRNMDRQRLAQLIVSGYVLSNVKMALFTNYQRIQFTEDYSFSPQQLTSFDQAFDVAEIGAEINWKYGEKFTLLGNTRISQGSKFPRVILKASKGISGIANASLDYLRLNLEISQQITLRGFGKLNWAIVGMKTYGDVPLLYQHATRATGKNWNLATPNTFETMLPSTFYCNEQINLFTRLTFLQWKTKVKIFQPQLSIHHAIGFGAMTQQNNHSNSASFQSMDKGYYEGGFVLDHILSTKLYGIGLGLFTNYGPYSNVKFDKNLMIKLSLSFAL